MKSRQLHPHSKKLYLLLIIFFCLSLKSFEQVNTWQQKAFLPGNPRFLATSFGIGNKGYLGLGFNYSVFFQDFWEYDPVADLWTQKADFGGGLRSAAAGFAIGNKGYVGTGSLNPSDEITKEFWGFDPVANTWTRKADFAGAARTVAQGFAIGNKGYIGLGRTGGFGLFADFWQYDPASDTWTQKANFAGGARYATSGFSIGSKGYIGTGTDFTGGGFTFRNDFWEYDQATDQWTQKANFAGGGRELAVGFSINNKGYIGTGLGANDFWEYNPTSNLWTKRADFGGGGRNMGTGFSVDGKGYIGTGDRGGVKNDLWQYSPMPTPPTTQWAKRPDIELAPYTNPSISSDGNGNTYVAGAFIGTATFATLPSPTILTSAGEADVFIAKYDASGNVLWAKRAGSTHSDAAHSIKYDGFGNLYLAGYFVESTNFDGTIITNSVSNSSNVFLAKYNATTGNFLWVRHGAGVDGYTRQAFDVAVDKFGDPYITGEICNTTTFAPLPTLTLSNRWWDIFVVKYNSAGVAQWQTTVGSFEAGYNGEGGTGIAVDQSGKVFVTGYFNGSSTYPTQFGNIDLVSNGGGGFYEYDYFLAKYDPSSSTWLWAVVGGGAANDYSKSVSLDSDGNPYVSGVFTGTATFGSNSLTSTGGNDYFIAKYSTDGAITWIHSAAGIGYFGGNRSKVDANGNFYFAGTFDGTVTVGDATITSTGFDNCYISYWDNNGVFQWVKHIPGSYYGHVSSIDIESNGNINFLDVFAQSETFDCTVLSAGSFTSLAIAKLGISNDGSQAPTVSASANPVCNGGSTVLSINNENFNNATVWKWYIGSCGGLLVGTGTSITVNPSIVTTYYVRGESECSGPGACASITITMGHVDVTIPDAKALNYNSIPFNTVYPAYAPASSITLTAQPSGTGPYGYSWSNGATSQSITVSPSSNTTYTVTVTDASGCVGTASKEVLVKNVNCGNGKVYMCHITGNSGHVNTICIDNNAVTTHLAAGCSLGECVSSRNAPSVTESEVSNVSIQILPNPSKNYFTLNIQTSDASPIALRVTDVLGRVVEVKTNVVAGRSVFGNKLSAGVYLAEIIQGTNRKVIKLVKQ